MKKFLFVLMLFVSVVSFSAIKYITQDGYLFTKTKEQLDEAFSYTSSDDREGFKKYVTQLMNTGNGGMLKGGIEVVVVETADFASVVKIRVVGDTTQIWTVREAIKRK